VTPSLESSRVTVADVVVADTVTTGALAMTSGTATVRAAFRAMP
jgi:uncharacterized protein with ACT and thioredoxin-like domain